MPLLDWFGQPAALARLQLMIRHDRLHHCLIFHGPEGVGKAGVAADFVRTLLCERPVGRPNREVGLPLLGDDAALRDACGECPSCRQAEAGTHPDVHVVLREAGKSTLSVKVINDKFLEKAHVKSHSGRLKAFLVPEADRIAEAGWNKLLKTLEEPPPQTLAILIAPSLDSILPTILSRAQVLRFGPLPAEFVERLLVQRHQLPAGEAAFLARFTGGSPGEALRRARTGLYKFKTELVSRLAGLGEADVFAVADRLLDTARGEGKSAEDAEETADDDPGDEGPAPAAPAGEAVRTALRGLLSVAAAFYRDVLLAGAGADPSLWTNADQPAEVRKAAARMPPAAVQRAIRALAAADVQIAGNVLPGLAVEAALGELAGR